jgi:manganese transport protein
VPSSTTNLDQVVRLPLIALVVLSSRCSVMGRSTECGKLIGTAIVTTGAIRAVNVMLVWQSVVS